MCEFLRHFILNRIERKGRELGSPIVEFDGKNIVVAGKDIYVSENLVKWLLNTHGFYLPLPSNAFGIVTYPDGTSRKLDGGLHEVPPGLYKLQYIDNQEHFDFTEVISEMTMDGEILMLKVIFRYRVIDPLIILRIGRPVETLIEHIQTDLAQYIRITNHNEVANSADPQNANKILAFFTQRHANRSPLSRAIAITGVELKDFTRDKEYFEMRRKARMDESKNKIEKEQAGYQQDLDRLKAQYKADNEKSIAEHKADMEKKATDHKAEIEKKEAEHKADMEKKATVHRAEIEKREAEHKKEKDEILHQVYLREIELDDKRKHLQMRGNEFSQVIDAISRAFSSGIPMNPNVMKNITDLFAAYKEEMDSELQSTSPVQQKSSASESHATQTPTAFPMSSDKVEKYKNTLLNLLNPKK